MQYEYLSVMSGTMHDGVVLQALLCHILSETRISSQIIDWVNEYCKFNIEHDLFC